MSNTQTITHICRCGRLAEEGKKSCPSCQAARRRYREKCRLQGRCQCGRQAVKGKKSCTVCLAAAKVKNAEVRAKALATGKCRCGRPVAHEGAIQCIYCNARQLVYQRERNDAIYDRGFCRCGKFAENPSHPAHASACSACLSKRERYYADHIKEPRIQRLEAQDEAEGCGVDPNGLYAQLGRLQEEMRDVPPEEYTAARLALMKKWHNRAR